MDPNHTQQVRRPIRADTVWEETRSRIFLSSMIVNSVDPHGIQHTAVFIMIVSFHQDTRLSDPSELWNSSHFSVYIRVNIADLYRMRHTAESHTDHHFPPRYEKGV